MTIEIIDSRPTVEVIDESVTIDLSAPGPQGVRGLQGAAGETGASGPAGPGVTQPSAGDRTPVVQTLGSSPFGYTCPANSVVQLTVTGGSGVAITIGGTTFIGGTGSSVLLTSGEVASVSWSTIPVIRTRKVMNLG